MEQQEIKRPVFVKLPRQYDPQKLMDDLNAAQRFQWAAEEPFTFKDFIGCSTQIYHDGKWKGLSLRAQGGKWDRTDPGGPGLEDYQNTEILEYTPYFKEIVESFDCHLRTVRLSLLPPGYRIEEHCDTFSDFKYGQIRLHIPIQTNPGVEMHIDGEKCYMAPGELWYGDYSKPHKVFNNSNEYRVHIILDATINENIMELFPEEFRSCVETEGVLYYQEPRYLPVERLREYECKFYIPASLMKGIFEMDDGIPGYFMAEMRVQEEKLTLIVDGRPLISLAYLGKHRFMMVGWTNERYFEFKMGESCVQSLKLVMRIANKKFESTFCLA